MRRLREIEESRFRPGPLRKHNRGTENINRPVREYGTMVDQVWCQVGSTGAGLDRVEAGLSGTGHRRRG